MGKSSLSSSSFVRYRPSQSIARCRSRYEADLSVSVFSFISSSMGQMGSTKSPSLELFSERTSSIQQNVKLKDWASFFSFFLINPCPKIFHYQHMIDKSINIEQVKALNLSASTKIKLIHSSIFINPRKKLFGIFLYTCYNEFRRLSPKTRPTRQLRLSLFCLW